MVDSTVTKCVNFLPRAIVVSELSTRDLLNAFIAIFGNHIMIGVRQKREKDER